MLTGAFDASSALFLIFRLINERTEGSFQTTKFFSLYLAVPLFIFLVQIFIMPTTSYKTAGELVQEAEAQVTDEANDQVDRSISDSREGERQRNDRRMHRQSVVSQIQVLLDGRGNDDHYGQAKGYLFDHENDEPEPEQSGSAEAMQLAQKPQPTFKIGTVWGALHGYSAIHQILTPWFILITAFTVLQMLRINYFVASINQQYTYLLSSAKKAKAINQAFDFLLPLGGLVSVPFIGTILDNVPTQFVLLILVLVATIIGVLGAIPHSMPAAYGNIVLFVLYRPFYYTSVSDYAAKVFGFQTFGKVYGLIICCAGVGNFLQAVLDAVTFKAFHRNPIPVNMILLVLGAVIGGVLVAYVTYKAYVIGKSAGNDERRPLLGGRSEGNGEQGNSNGETITYGTVI